MNTDDGGFLNSYVIPKKKKSGILTFAFILAFVYFISAVPIYADTPTPAPHEKLIGEIKANADRHVRGDSPMQTQLVVSLYSNNTVELSSVEIAQIYEEEYTRLKEEYKPSSWEQLKLKMGWIAALIFLLSLIFHDILKKLITLLIESASNQIYKKLAGRKFFFKTTLRHYKKALIDKYYKLLITFRYDRPLDMRKIYVPVKMADSISDAQTDTNKVIADFLKIMVLGSPGAGKSMLLKHIVLEYAEGSFIDLIPDQPVPILLELHRLNDNSKSLEQHLVEELARNDFPNARHFVSQGLKQGTLMLLLDGFDEVNNSERERVVQQINDLLGVSRKCRVIITCRKAIYNNEFSNKVDNTLEIAEFSDKQIRSFLGSWEIDMPVDRSVDHLMQTLQSNPKIMALARNPLLLTIIAYLYTDTPHILPHSRSEFYKLSTDVLLQQWHQERNNFEARNKKLVLQHLSLFFQDSANQRQQDRRSVDYKTVLEQVQMVLPGLNLQPENASILLNEIVERSGLLLSIDGGERYQFAHLTLQEFFAASELIDDPDGLFDRFKSDNDAWRETVKLWCGLIGDSTTIIQKVYDEHPITAFECLSDAQKVDRRLSDEIIEVFKDRLGTNSEDDVIIQAFGTVASDLRPRGSSVFKFLEETLAKTKETSRQAAASKALSLTNLPQAATVLADYYNIPEARDSLVLMGDLAVPALRSLEKDESLDDLYTIGTPQAAESLVSFLWHNNVRLSARAAWLLSALLNKPGIENSLRKYKLSEGQRKENYIDWIWKPFNEPPDSALPIIAGRIAYILDTSGETPPSFQLSFDSRLVIPICSIQHGNEISRIRIDFPTTDTESINLIEITKKFLDEKILNPSLRCLLKSLQANQLVLLFRKLENPPLPTRDDWINIFRPLKYNFYKSWHYRMNIILTFIAVSVILGQIYYLASVDLLTGFKFFFIILIYTVILYNNIPIKHIKYDVFEDLDKNIRIQFKTNWDISDKTNLNSIKLDLEEREKQYYKYLINNKKYATSKIFSGDEIHFKAVRQFKNVSIKLIVIYNLGLFVISSIIFYILAPLFKIPIQYVIIFWSTLIGTCLLLWLIGKQRERKAQNPLQGIL